MLFTASTHKTYSMIKVQDLFHDKVVTIFRPCWEKSTLRESGQRKRIDARTSIEHVGKKCPWPKLLQLPSLQAGCRRSFQRPIRISRCEHCSGYFGMNYFPRQCNRRSETRKLTEKPKRLLGYCSVWRWKPTLKQQTAGSAQTAEYVLLLVKDIWTSVCAGILQTVHKRCSKFVSECMHEQRWEFVARSKSDVFYLWHTGMVVMSNVQPIVAHSVF